MADVNANIGVNIDTSAALTQLKALQRQISQFHSSISRSSESAALAQKSLQKNLLGSINSIGAFSAELRNVRTSAESFTNSLEKNKFGMREYFRYAGASTKTFGRLFKSEFDTIGRVAEERVKTLQTQYIKMGRNASGAMEAIAIRPTSLNMQDYGTKTAIAAQKQALFNQLMKQGTTNLLNFGKNTQWAGRQLMVGFTIPLSIVGSTATKTFMDMEAQALKFRKVYGDLFTPKEETKLALDNITEIGKQFTKYGIAVSQTVGLAAEAAAAGFQGLDLQRQTTEATRLSVLGQIDSQKALETTISLQNAFGMSSDKLADSINFLNAVENQTVVSLDDITTAIPKVAPVIQQLGGDVKDLTFFIAAMKEGGINASEGANALKSGLAALINPTKKASDMLSAFGINATAIVEKNKGNLKATVIEFATALNQLDPLNRAQAIEQMFGKFQFARLSTLFANVAKDGNQASRVLDLANASVQELSDLSEQELGMTADSAMNKFKKSVEDLKFALIPIGQAFLEAATPIIEFVGGILEKFGNLSNGTKKLITVLTIGIGAIGPIFLMTFGLLANALANTLKGAMILRNGYLRLTGQSQILGEQTQYLNTEQLEAAAAAHSLDQSHARLTQSFTAETAALQKLIAAYQSGTRAAQSFAFNNPGMMMTPRGGRKLASGIVSVPGPKGAGDIVPAMLSPGEAVIPSDMAKKYAPLIQGMIANNIPGYQNGNISFGGKSFSVNPRGQVPIQRMINETKNLSSVIENIDNLILNALMNAENELTAKGKVRVASLQNQLKTIAGGAIPLAKTTAAAQGGFRGNAGVVAAHGTPSRPITASQAQQLGRQLGSGAVANQLMNTKGNARLLSNLTFPMPASFNKEQLTGKEAAQFVGQNRTRFTSMIAQQNKLNPNDPGLLEFGQSIGQALKQVGNNVVSERDFENIIATGIENMLEGAAKTALTRSRNTFGTAQLSGVSGREGHGGIQRVTLPSSATGQTFGGLQLGGQSYRQQDISQYNVQADKFVLETIKKRTKNFGSSMVVAVEEGLRETLQAASPSRKMKKIGQDAGQGLILGAQEYVDDAKMVGQKLGAGMVQTASGLLVPGSVAAGLPMSQAQQGIRTPFVIPKETYKQAYKENKQRDQEKIIGKTNERLGKFNGKIMGGTFALTSLAGMASMAGGNLGKLSEIIFKISGVAFAFSSILNIIPKGLLSFLLKNKIGFGVLGLAIAGVTAIIKISNKVREDERKKLESFGDSIKNTEDQVKSLGEYFSVIPTKTPLESTKIAPLRISSERQALDKFKESEAFKDLASTAEALSKLSNSDAEAALRIKGFELLGKGFSKEDVQLMTDALVEESGKYNVKVDFKNLQIGDKSVSALTGDIGARLIKLSNLAPAEITKKAIPVLEGFDQQGQAIMKIKQFTYFSDNLKAEIKNNATAINSYLTGLSGSLANGQINVQQFNKGYKDFIDMVKRTTPDATLQTEIFNMALSQMDSPLAKAAVKVNDLKNKTLLLQAAMFGVQGVTEAMIATLNQPIDRKTDPGEGAREARGQQTVIDFINKQMKATKKLIEIQQQSAYSPVEKTVKTQRDALKQAQDFIALQEQLIDMQNAGQLKAYNDELEKQEEILKTINREIDSQTEKSITPIEKKIKENSYLIDQIAIKEDEINEKYAVQIDALTKVQKINEEIVNSEKERTSLADALSRGDISAAATIAQDARARRAASSITNLESSLATSRDNEIKALGRNELEKTNKQLQLDIAKIQREQIDILIEQKLVVEKKIQEETKLRDELNKQIETQKEQITYLGLTKEAIDESVKALDLAQNENINIKSDSFIRNVLLGALGDANALKKALDEVAIASANAFNSAAAQKIISITGGAESEDPSPNSGNKNNKNNNNKDGGGKDDPVEIKKDIVEIKNTVIGLGLGAVGRGEYAKPYRINDRMYGGFIKRMNMGGVVPKYFSNSGRMGSDTVPAMLTPGEFVMNKRASQEFGPLLSMLNESKYPSMIGSSYNSQAGSIPSVRSISDNSSSVYNYNVGITVPQSSANPNDIARTVIGQIKYIDNQRIRGQK